MTDTNWVPDLSAHEGPKFRALATALREDVRSGRLPPGTRLPPMRDLAWRLGVTPGTVARAYQIAAAEGVVDSHVGRGSYIAENRPRFGSLQPLLTGPAAGSAGENPCCSDLRIPQLPECGQIEAMRQAMTTVAAGMGQEALDYPPLTGDRACRQALLDWLSKRNLGKVGADDIVLAHGGQNAMSLIMGLCLTGERPRIICEALSYPGLRHLARQHRAEITTANLDDQGMVPESLDRVARVTGARLVFLTPSAQNPTCARMSPERRAKIVEVARHHDLQIIEDECFSGPARNVQSLRALAPDRVWHVTSLSKVFSAGLRFGLIVCPEAMGEAGRLAAQHSFFGLSMPVTAMVTELLTSGAVARLSAQVQAVYDDRVQLARRILWGTDLVSFPGLPFIWLRLPQGWHGSTFLRRAAEERVLLRSADEFSVCSSGNQPIPNAVRIALGGRMPREQLEQALLRLRRLYDMPPGDLPV